MKNIKPYQKLASVYDESFSKNFYEKYFAFIKWCIEKNKIKDPQILDLACGTGSLIEKLKKYFPIQGVDQSEEMLNIAKKKNPDITFFCQDFINLETDKKYNIIICTFDSINYLLNTADLTKAIKNVSLSLEYSGIFIFDFNTKNKKVDSISKQECLVFNNSIKNNFWDTSIKIYHKNGIDEENHKERLYDIDEIENTLANNQLKIVGIYENFGKKVSRNSTAGRLFIIAKKIK